MVEFIDEADYGVALDEDHGQGGDAGFWVLLVDAGVVLSGEKISE